MALLPAVRYLDPGTGSMILQYLAAVLLTALFVLKMYFKKIKNRVQNYLGMT